MIINIITSFLNGIFKSILTFLIMIRTIMIAFLNGINSKPLKGEGLI